MERLEEQEKERRKKYLEQLYSIQMYIFSEISFEIKREEQRRDPSRMIEAFWEEVNLYGNGRGLDEMCSSKSHNSKSSFVETVALQAVELTEQVKKLFPDPTVSKELTDEDKREISNRVFKRLEEESPEMITIRNEVMGVIDGVKNLRGKLLLKRRYINCKAWKEVQSELNISKTTAFGLLDSVLGEITIPKAQETRAWLEW